MNPIEKASVYIQNYSYDEFVELLVEKLSSVTISSPLNLFDEVGTAAHIASDIDNANIEFEKDKFISESYIYSVQLFLRNLDDVFFFTPAGRLRSYCHDSRKRLVLFLTPSSKDIARVRIRELTKQFQQESTEPHKEFLAFRRFASAHFILS